MASCMFINSKRTPALVLAVWIALADAGCSTIVTRYSGPEWTPPSPTLPRLYSGTLFDMRCFFRPAMHETEDIRWFCLLDVPFSLAADTIILPLTIYEQVKYGSYATGR